MFKYIYILCYIYYKIYIMFKKNINKKINNMLYVKNAKNW